MGEELTDILEKISKGQKIATKGAQFMNVGVDTLPEFPKDNTDRNRTSPLHSPVTSSSSGWSARRSPSQARMWL